MNIKSSLSNDGFHFIANDGDEMFDSIEAALFSKRRYE